MSESKLLSLGRSNAPATPRGEEDVACPTDDCKVDAVDWFASLVTSTAARPARRPAKVGPIAHPVQILGGCLSNCDHCKHRTHQIHAIHCYMFLDEPQGVCMNFMATTTDKIGEEA